MFVYNKKLQFPVKIDKTDPKLASIIISQYGGPDGELGASLRYLSQRFSMPYPELQGLLTDIGTTASICNPPAKKTAPKGRRTYLSYHSFFYPVKDLTGRGKEISFSHKFSVLYSDNIPNCTFSPRVLLYRQGKGDTNVHVILNGLMQIMQKPQTVANKSVGSKQANTSVFGN